jgi:hypothetical protein
MVGAALVRRMASEDTVLLTVPHAQLDLRRQTETEDWIATIGHVRNCRPLGELQILSRPFRILSPCLVSKLLDAPERERHAWSTGIGSGLGWMADRGLDPIEADLAPIHALLGMPRETDRTVFRVAGHGGSRAE